MLPSFFLRRGWDGDPRGREDGRFLATRAQLLRQPAAQHQPCGGERQFTHPRPYTPLVSETASTRLREPDAADLPAAVQELWERALEKLGFVPNVLRNFAFR